MPRRRLLWRSILGGVAAGIVAACATDVAAPDRTEPDKPSQFLGLLNLGLVKCTPQPSASRLVSIGAAGGVITVNGHRLSVPAGALDSTVAIRMEAPSDTIRSVRFSPEGLQFNPDHLPTLRMDYRDCSLLSLLSKRIVYTNEQWDILEWLLSIDLRALLKVEAHIDHFSRYAIHY